MFVPFLLSPADLPYYKQGKIPVKNLLDDNILLTNLSTLHLPHMKHALLTALWLMIAVQLNALGQENTPASRTLSSAPTTSTTTASATTPETPGTTVAAGNTRADTIVKNDFLLFVGSNIDPNNNDSPVTSTSFEGIFKFTLGEGIHMRTGAYSNRNFTTDSGAVQRTVYINTIPGSRPAIDTTQLAVQRYSLDRETTTKSIGFYTDLFIDLTKPDNKNLRVSWFVRYEYVYRSRSSPITALESRFLDTIPYTRQLSNQGILINNLPVTRDNLFTFPTYLNQHYITTGFAVEKSTKAFDIFLQPTFGIAFTSQRFQRFDRQVITTTRQATVGFKAQATVKVLDITLTADIKDLTTPNPFTNISLGIPISYSKITERVKKAME